MDVSAAGTAVLRMEASHPPSADDRAERLSGLMGLEQLPRFEKLADSFEGVGRDGDAVGGKDREHLHNFSR